MQTVEQRVTDVVVMILGVDPEDVKPETNLVEELGADSLDQVEIVTALEEEFAFEIPDEDVEHFTKVSELVPYIEGRLK